MPKKNLTRQSAYGGLPIRPLVWMVMGVVISTAAVAQSDETASDPSSLNAVKPTTITESCVTTNCHVGITDHKVTHGPVAQGKCEACHASVQPEEHQFTLVKAAEVLCENCHTLQNRTVVHQPVKQGACLSCHDPHGSDQAMMLVADPTRGLCLECHQQEGFSDKKFKHGPVAAGACIVCHEPHSSWEADLLVQSPGKLCLSCHLEVVRSNAERHVHPPAQEGCADCHDPHASDLRYQLRQDTPELCFSCHESLQKQLAEAQVTHGAMTQPGGCLGCHKPHSSQLPNLQRAAQTELCLSCHDKPLQTADGRTLTNMAALLKDNPNHHSPLRTDGCSACHQPHAGVRDNLLVKEYPPEFYAPYAIERYDLCFSCHQSQMVQDRSGTGLTRFRNDDLNLHWLHVNREKGRTCRACHEVHASKNPFHIRDAVPFGSSGWMLELRYEQTDTGGFCSPGCHDLQGYDREPSLQGEP